MVNTTYSENRRRYIAGERRAFVESTRKNYIEPFRQADRYIVTNPERPEPAPEPRGDGPGPEKSLSPAEGRRI